MKSKFVINSFGTKHICRFTGSKKSGVRILCRDEDDPSFWEPFGDFTTSDRVSKDGSSWAIKNYTENEGWADDLVEKLVEAGLAKETGSRVSSYNILPVLTFTEDFWTKMCSGADEEDDEIEDDEPKSTDEDVLHDRLRKKTPFFKVCPMCNTVHSLNLNQPEMFMVERYETDPWGSPIQNALSFLNAAEREFVKTGYCSDCQEMLFGNDLLSKSERYA